MIDRTLWIISKICLEIFLYKFDKIRNACEKLVSRFKRNNKIDFFLYLHEMAILKGKHLSKKKVLFYTSIKLVNKPVLQGARYNFFIQFFGLKVCQGEQLHLAVALLTMMGNSMGWQIPLYWRFFLGDFRDLILKVNFWKKF